MTTLRYKTIPGPRSLNPLKTTLAFRDRPLEFLAELQQRYGDIAQFRMAIWQVVFISHPDYIKHVLQDNYHNYDKEVILFQATRPLVGNGLVSAAGGDDWRRQRRLVQPAFHRQRIAALGTLMTDTTNTMLQQWDTYAREGQVFDIVEEMTKLTLKIVSKALFNVDIHAESNELRQATLRVNTFFVDYMSRPFPPLFIPAPRNRRFWAAVRTIDSVVYEIIRNRREHQEDVGDLLAMLLNAVDESGQAMDDKLMRDEIVTLLLAGHETSADALTWTCYALAQHQEAQEHLHAELDQVLGGRTPTVEDLPQLHYTRMVIEEAMRLYPPAWLLMRRAIQADEMGGHYIPANSNLYWSPYVFHRHPEFWEKPEQFCPEHFSPECTAKRPRHAYMPFGSGPRICVGNSFAMTEMLLVIATVFQQYRVSLVPGQHIELEPLITLRPKEGLLVSLERRA